HRWFVRVVDAGEARHGTGPLAGVEAFDVALGAHVDRRRDVHLHEAVSDALAHVVASGAVGRHHRADGDNAVPGEEGGDVADAAHVLVPIGAAVAEVGAQLGPHHVAVEHLHRPALGPETLGQCGGDGGLAGRRQAREPHDGAAHRSASPRRRRMRRSIVPNTSESTRMPMISTISITAVRPAASESGRSTARRLPTNGLLAMRTSRSPAMRLRHANAHPCLRPTRNEGHSDGRTMWWYSEIPLAPRTRPA